MTVSQGHTYTFGHITVLALEYGDRCIQVAPLDLESPWPLQAPMLVHASLLRPLPMKYYAGEVPQ